MYSDESWRIFSITIAPGSVLAANAITLITTLSFSSIATNITVRTGGVYYIISRSL